MVDALSAEELDTQIELRRVRFKQVISDIRGLLHEDLRNFINRETKRAFLGQAVVSKGFDRARVGALKRASAELAQATADRIVAELEDEALWLPESLPASVDKRSIDGVPGAWAKVTEVDVALAELLGGYGFDLAEVTKYHVPAFFVKGLYMPSLAEHFWRLLTEIHELEGQKVQRLDEEVRSELQSLWDEA